MMLEVLHPLALKGLARPGDLAEATGLSEQDVDARLAELAEAGLARLRGGRISRWTVTEDGRARRAELLRASVTEAGAEREVESAYETFLPVNGAFKALCTRWQDDRDATRAG